MSEAARCQILIRMRPEDKSRIKAAARAESLSMSAFMTRAALAMARKPAVGTESVPSDAVAGLELLQLLGWTLQQRALATRGPA